MIQYNDVINGMFELFGGLLVWFNVKRLRKDKKVCGISWQIQAFFTSWEWWNVYYYPSLNQWVSCLGGAILAIGNTVWVIFAIYYIRRNKNENCQK